MKKIWTSLKCLCSLCLLVNIGFAQSKEKPIWQNKSFKLYKDSVVQENKFTGKALSATRLSSNYERPANEFISPSITFKFSINGKDNEMKSGIDHHYNILSDSLLETPVIKFGQQSIDKRSVPDNTYLRPQTKLRIRVDMRDVLADFEKVGYYTTFDGNKIYKSDFKGLYVAGNTSPLSWDFDNLVNKPELKMNDDDKDGVYETVLSLNNPKEKKQTSSNWEQSRDVSAFPHYQSDYPISDAMYNLALEEMTNAVEPDSTFRTGKRMGRCMDKRYQLQHHPGNGTVAATSGKIQPAQESK